MISAKTIKGKGAFTMCKFAASINNQEIHMRVCNDLPSCILPSGITFRLAQSNRQGFLSRSGFLLNAFICLLFLSAAPLLRADSNLSFLGVVSTLSTPPYTLSQPSDITVDTAGNIYIADTSNNQIVKVNPQGVASVLTISGLNTPLKHPRAIKVDGSGNLYIADTANSRIVEVTSSGSGSVLSTGGVTLSSPQGIAIDSSGNIFIADTGHNQIVKVTSGGGAAVFSITGLSSPATLNAPTGMAVDTFGNLYIADSSNNRIVTVAAGGTAGSVLSISGLSTGLNTPGGIIVDSLGNVYIADTINDRIVEVMAGGAGTVLSTNSLTLGLPKGVAVDTSGEVFIVDTNHNRTVTVATSAVGFGHLQLGSSAGISLTLPFNLGATEFGAVQAFTLGTQNLDFTVGPGTTCTAGMSNVGCSVEIKFLPTAPGLRRGAVVLYDTADPPDPMLTVPLYATADAPVAALAPNTASVINTGGVTLKNPLQIALDGAGNMYVGSHQDAKVL
jgi:DNA-binding beta-propeller fold protein YncE